jgi:hypothetical protein
MDIALHGEREAPGHRARSGTAIRSGRYRIATIETQHEGGEPVRIVNQLLEKLVVAGLLCATSGSALARNTPTLPEPSTLSILGAGVVAGIIAYRIKRRK